MNCRFINNKGEVSKLHTELYNYLRTTPQIDINSVNRILLTNGLFTQKRDKSGVSRTYLKMGKDVLYSKTTVQGINNRIKQFFGENTPDLINTKFIKRTFNPYGNKYGNDVYSVELNPSTIFKMNKDLKQFDVLEETRKEALLYEQEQEEGFLKKFTEANEDIIPVEQRGSIFKEDTLEQIEKKINILSKSLDVNVIIDSDIEFSRVDAYDENQKPTIRLNPKKIFKDTVVHEYAHIYVDLLGGMDNLFLLEGIEQLRDQPSWNYVIENYPQILVESDEFYKEVLATQIGWEGAKLADKSPFMKWLNIFFEKLKGLIGIETSVAKELAGEMLSNQIRDISKGKLSNYIQEQRISSSEEKALIKAKNAIRMKLALLKNKISSISEDDARGEAKKQYFDSLEALLKELENLKDTETSLGLVHFVNRAVRDVNNVLERVLSLKETDIKYISTNELEYMKNFVSAYKNLTPDINDALNESTELKQLFKDSIILESFEALDGKIRTIEKNYLDISRNIYAEKLAQRGGRISTQFRDKYAQEFKSKNQKLSGETKEQFEDRKRAYINNLMVKNQDTIYNLELDNFKKLLITSPKDLSSIDLWVTAGANLNDDLIAYAVELLEKADYNTRQEFASEINNISEVYKRFIAEKGRGGILFTNSVKLYDELIENKIGGGKTNNYVSRYYSEFYTEKQAKASQVDWKVDKSVYTKTPEFKEYVKWLNANTIQTEEGRLASVKWQNPQFDNLNKLREQKSAIAEMYDHLVDLNRKKDKKLPSYARLYYRMPGITKQMSERISVNGILDTVKDSFTDLTSVKPDDIDFQKIYTLANEAGLERQSVPVHYRGRINIEDQSFDLATMALIDFKMAANYRNKVGLVSDMNILTDVVENRVITSRSGSFPKFNAVNKEEELTTSGSQSNALKAIKSITEQRLYGIKNVGSGHKLAGALTRWNGGVALAVNYFSATTNLAQGKLMNKMEAATGGLVTSTALRAAEVKYWADSKNNISDFSRKTVTSKTHKLNQLFNVDNIELESTFLQNSFVKKKLNSSVLNLGQELGEHYIQNTMMYSILSTIKVINNQGQYLTKEGTTTNINEAIGLDEAYKLQDGKLILDPRAINSTKGVIDQDFNFKVSRLINKVNKELYGNYTTDDISLSQRYAAGKLVFFLRKWMVPGYKKRFRGWDTKAVFKGKDKLDTNMAYYSPETGEMEEGTYFTAARFLVSFMKDLKQLKYKRLSTSEDLTDYEIRNVKKARKEALMIVGCLVTSFLLEGLAEDADDDEKEFYYFMAYTSRRLYSELFFYSNPIETIKIAKSPTASVSFVEDVIDVLEYALPWSWDEIDQVYKNGKRKGQLKITKEIGDVIPILNMRDRSAEDSYSWLVK